MAGGSTSSRRGLHAYRLLRGDFSRCHCELRDWQPLRAQWLARYVCGRRITCAVARLGAPRRERALALEAQSRHCEFLASLEAIRRSIFKIAAPPHYSQHNVYARFHFWLWAGTVYVPSAVPALAEAAR